MFYPKTTTTLGYAFQEICVHCSTGDQDILFGNWKIRQSMDCSKAVSVKSSLGTPSLVNPWALKETYSGMGGSSKQLTTTGSLATGWEDFYTNLSQ